MRKTWTAKAACKLNYNILLGEGIRAVKRSQRPKEQNIIVTDKAKDYFASVLNPLEEAESAAWEDFSDEELISFIKTLEKYVASFEKVLKVKKI